MPKFHIMQQTKLKTILVRCNYFLRLLIARLLNKAIPVICCVVVNNRCNLNCKYCFGDYAKRKTPDYTTGELKILINQLYQKGTRYLIIHGGETLLREDIGEIVKHIKSKGIYCCLITNGILVPQKIDAIRNVDNITVSLDGRRENHDENRGKGSFDKALEAIKLVIRENIPLRVSATITSHTRNDIGFLANLAKEFGFTVQFSILFASLPPNNDCTMSDGEIRDAMSQIIEYKKRGFPIFTSYRVAEYARKWPLDHNQYHFIKRPDMHQLPENFRRIRCFYAKNTITIDADGNVYPCFVLLGHFKPLNWKEVGIERAIQHVQQTNDCFACPGMTMNDHNLLMGMNIKQIMRLVVGQLSEASKAK